MTRITPLYLVNLINPIHPKFWFNDKTFFIIVFSVITDTGAYVNCVCYDKNQEMIRHLCITPELARKEFKYILDWPIDIKTKAYGKIINHINSIYHYETS